MAHPPYRADIDGLRAVAVLAVVAFHAFPKWISGGFVGVDVFFVISGFLISTILLKSQDLGSFSFLDFYARRVKRIFPALILVLGFTFAFGWFMLLGGEMRQLGKHIAGGAGFVSNLMLWAESGYFDSAADTKPLLHLWSLGIEEQYYIVWPVVIWLFYRKNLHFPWLMLALGLASLAAGIHATANDIVAAFYSPLTRFWELLAGSALAWHELNCGSRSAELRRRFANVLSLLGLLLLVSGMGLLNGQSAFPGWLAMLPVLGAVALIAAGPAAWINARVLANPVAVWFGLISFPLYLWHWPLLTFARIFEGKTPDASVRAAAVLLSVVLAFLTYRLLELRLRRIRRESLKTAVLASLMLAAGLLGVYTAASDGYAGRAVVKNNVEPPATESMETQRFGNCTERADLAAINKLCSREAGAAPLRTIAVWGDSTARAWTPVFRQLAKEQNLQFISIVQPSCPPLLEVRKTQFAAPESKRYCSDGKNQRDSVELLRSLKPDVIFMLASWNSYSPYSNREFMTDRANEWADAATTARALHQRVPETVQALAAIAKLVVFTPWPHMPESPYNKRIVFPSLQAKKTEITLARNEFDAESASINKILAQMDHSNVLLFDPAEKICDRQKCVSNLHGLQLYEDIYHIAPEGALMFKSSLQEILADR